jgi:phosphoribosylformylglycinamidine cyclo-ligase
MSGERDAYRDAGVDIAAGEAVVDGIRGAVASTHREGVLGGIGGFGGLFALGRYRDPVLVSGTDGVGTKLLVAQRLGRHRTIGIDLVAMCVNDIAVTGAEPLFFLDYFATGKLAPEVTVEVVEGIADGCRQAGCALIGGETAEMPGMYSPGHYDLAGFAVGAVERAEILAPRATVRPGDRLLAWPSSGLHSNGYSLVRRLVDALDWSAEHGLGRPLGEVLLTPTRIYVRELLAARGAIKGAAHITGGGLIENLPRILPDGLGARLDGAAWQAPPIFGLLAERGGLSQRELHRTFNMGLGMVCAVAPERASEGALEGALEVGEVVAVGGGDERVVIA